MTKGTRDRDDVRFVELYERHHDAVHAYCRRRVSPDRVEDVMGETFLVAWRKIESAPLVERALPWLYGIAYRAVLHQWRSTSRRRKLEQRLTGLAAPRPSLPEELIVTNEEARRVMESASHLKPTDQEILKLSLWEELSHAEISVALDLGPDAVRQRLSRALKNLTKTYNRLEQRTAPAAQEGGVK